MKNCTLNYFSLPSEHAEDVAVLGQLVRRAGEGIVVQFPQEAHQLLTAVSQLLRAQEGAIYMYMYICVCVGGMGGMYDVYDKHKALHVHNTIIYTVACITECRKF